MNNSRATIPINPMILKSHNFLEYVLSLGAPWGHSGWHSVVKHVHLIAIHKDWIARSISLRALLAKDDLSPTAITKASLKRCKACRDSSSLPSYERHGDFQGA